MVKWVFVFMCILLTKGMEICYEIVSYRNVRSYIYENSLMSLPKHNPNKSNTIENEDMKGGKLMRPQP